MSYSEENLENFLIPVKEIERANKFSSFMCLGSHGYSRGDLSEPHETTVPLGRRLKIAEGNSKRAQFTSFTQSLGRNAYKCISLNIKDRPTMDEIVKTLAEAFDIHNQGALSRSVKLKLELQKKFQIPLEEINKASRDFHEIN
ncbi:hypothetical protein Tco_0874446 [Tanacetum coccineum]|uniref:LAGLIDADG homing endonuclease n=1 Tax=Tanacetum coccineum TaxID=301880 RepID=A0ABQ5BLN9_9ASTR